MAKDYKSNPYHLEAVVLAGLAVKEIGTDILAIKALTANEQRIKYMRVDRVEPNDGAFDEAG